MEKPHRIFEKFLSRWAWLLLLAVAALTVLPGTDTLPLIDRDEPRFVRATVEMDESGQWIIPYFNGEYRFDKPPLTYWWMQLHFTFLGQNDFAARLHSVVSSWLCALAIFSFGRRLFNARTGFYAGFAFLSCLQILIHGRLAVADMPMILAVILMMRAGWELFSAETFRPFTRWFWVLYFAGIFGFMAKGPIVFFVPILAWLLYRLVLWRKPVPWGRLQWFNGLMLTATFLALWGIPALVLTDGAYWNVGIGTHIVERGTAAFNGRFSFPLYYLFSSFISLMPWVAFAWACVVKIRRNWDVRTAYLVAWLLSPLLIFSFYATQLPHYTMPGFAAFFLLLFRPSGEGVDCSPLAAVRASKGEQRFYKAVNCIWIFVTLVLIAIVLVERFPEGLEPLRAALAGVALTLTGLLFVGFSFRGRVPSFWGTVAGLAAIAVGWASAGQQLRPLLPAIQMQPWFAAMKPETKGEKDATGPALSLIGFFDKAFAQAGKEAADPHWRGYIFQEPSLVYYSGQKWEFIQTPEELEALKVCSGEALVALRREWRAEDYAKFVYQRARGWYQNSITKMISPTDDFSSELAWPAPHGYVWRTVEGVNFARFAWVELRVLLPRELDEQL